MRIWKITALALALALGGAACDDGDDDTATEEQSDEAAGGSSDSLNKGTFLIEPRDGEEESSDDDEEAEDEESEGEETEEADEDGTGFVTVVDSTETVEVDVPDTWTDLA